MRDGSYGLASDAQSPSSERAASEGPSSDEQEPKSSSLREERSREGRNQGGQNGERYEERDAFESGSDEARDSAEAVYVSKRIRRDDGSQALRTAALKGVRSIDLIAETGPVAFVPAQSGRSTQTAPYARSTDSSRAKSSPTTQAADNSSPTAGVEGDSHCPEDEVKRVDILGWRAAITTVGQRQHDELNRGACLMTPHGEEEREGKGEGEGKEGEEGGEEVWESWSMCENDWRLMEKKRKKWQIQVSGRGIPPLLPTFAQMGLPTPLLRALSQNGIGAPTHCQMQALPVVLSGRDAVITAPTGTGKTLSFALPMALVATELERRLRLIEGEGPFCLVLAPSRELASQTLNVISLCAEGLRNDPDEPSNRNRPLELLLVSGGSSLWKQKVALEKGVHIVSATLGRLKELREKNVMHLRQCQLIALDECDRLLDAESEPDLRACLNGLPAARQTVLFSATMPPRLLHYVSRALNEPIFVHKGSRIGAAAITVTQVVEYVVETDSYPAAKFKLPLLLQRVSQGINSTPSLRDHDHEHEREQTIVFVETKKEASEVLEYLLEHHVNACAVHGGLQNADRQSAIKKFQEGACDVLVATEVASKGLDFPNVTHVVNLHAPNKIDSYVHRIGRAGRGGRSGLATTFVSRDADWAVLMDLRELLIQNKQKVPVFIERIFQKICAESGQGQGLRTRSEAGCCFVCGGFGHRKAECPSLGVRRRFPSQPYDTHFGLENASTLP